MDLPYLRTYYIHQATKGRAMKAFCYISLATLLGVVSGITVERYTESYLSGLLVSMGVGALAATLLAKVAK